jgi:uncharacterized protein YfaS (alpha-2-macroglobulin family)
LDEGDGPNVFVSVMLIQGASESPYEEGRPRVRLGYANLKVERASERLAVELISASGGYQPRDSVEIDLSVNDWQGLPVEGAEVTLYAVDEGVLSLLETPAPRPLETFYPLQSHGVRTGTSLPNLMPDRRLQGYYGNKGMVIGDGGGLVDDYRSDFRACAYWNASLRTDARGRVEVVFPAPDSLTRYRVMAVVQAKGVQFGSAQTSFEVNKPLMLQPVVPRFAHVSEKVNVKALIHNRTEASQRLRASLEVGSATRHLEEASSLRAQEIVLGPGNSKTLVFPVGFQQEGEADWRWSVRSLDDSEVRDQVVSRFPVRHPIPLRQERRKAQVMGGDPPRDLLQGFDSEILHGEGRLRITLSNTRIVEAAAAIEQMLSYPYG